MDLEGGVYFQEKATTLQGNNILALVQEFVGRMKLIYQNNL